MKVLAKKDWFHPDGFPIVVERRDPQEPFGLHCHEFAEIVIITGGTGMHITGEDSYELKAGDTFVIGGDRPHDYLNMDRLSLINVLFVPEELPLSVGDLPSMPGYHALFTLEPAWRKRDRFTSRLQLNPPELVEAMKLVDQMESELHNRAAGFRAMSVAAMVQLATYLSRCFSKSRNPASKKLLRIAEAISHIRRNYADPISLDDLVMISGMSRRNFIRTFEATFDTSPINYLIQLRLGEGRRMLETSAKSITQIAFDVGFSDSNYFSRQFRKTYGQSPREFRKQIR